MTLGESSASARCSSIVDLDGLDRRSRQHPVASLANSGSNQRLLRVLCHE